MANNFAAAMLAPARELTLRGTLIDGSGTRRTLAADDIMSFSVDEGMNALLLGGVLSAKYALAISNAEGVWDDIPLAGATVIMEIGVKLDDSYAYSPMGVFVIETAVARGARVYITGNDSITTETAAAFTDGLAYPATLANIWAHALSQTRYQWSGNLPNGSFVISAMPEWGNISVRQAMGYIAAAAGCFVSLDREGALQLSRVNDASADITELAPESYMRLDRGYSRFGALNCLRIINDDEQALLRYDSSVPASVSNTLEIRGNPLRAAMPGALNELHGLTMNGMAFRYRGSPLIGIGDRVSLGGATGIVSMQSFKFDKGLAAEITCYAPEGRATGLRAITPEGRLNASMLTGIVDGGMIAADSVTARAIAANAITSEKLAASVITADKLAANAVDSQALSAIRAEIEGITSTTIETDRLAVALGEFVALYAGVIGIDYGSIKDLVAGTAIITEGVGGELFITRLAVDDANIVSVSASKLSAGTIDAAEIDVINLNAANLTVGTINGQQIAPGAISTQNIAAGAITEELIAEGCITPEKLAAGAITGDKLALGAVAADKLNTALHMLY